MRKLGIGKRLLTLLLALTIFTSMFPQVFAADGDLSAGKTGLSTNIDTGKTISWPIKIYDYLNDGMLFEYSSASDFVLDMADGSYGGGTRMPMNSDMPGMDFTVSSTYESYAFKNWGNKTSYKYAIDTGTIGATDVIRSAAAAQEDEDPMYLHLTYADYAATVQEKAYGWIANFARDDGKYYTGDQVRYMAIVYRTGGTYPASGHTIRPYWAVSDSSYDSDSDYHTSGIDISDLTDYFGQAVSGDKTGTLIGADTGYIPGSSEWTVFVIDMKSNYSKNVAAGIATNWTVNWDTDDTNELDLSTMARVAGIGMSFPLCLEGETMDISHIAFFSSEEEARNFGNNAIAFNNDPGEYVGKSVTVTQSRSGGGTATSSYTAPTVSKGLDMTKTVANGGTWNDAAVTNWTTQGLDYDDLKSHTSGGHYYARISDDSDAALDIAYVKYGSTYYNVADYQYITVVYRTNIASPKLGFWLERGTTYAGKGFNGSSYEDKRVSITQSTGDWKSLVYDLSQINSWDGDYNTYFKGKQFDSIGIMFPGFTNSGQYMDIAYVNFASSSSAANTFATNAKNYLNNFSVSDGTSVVTSVSTSGTEYKWNMGSNQAFTMLYSSNGGGWFDDGVDFTNYNNYTGATVGTTKAADNNQDNGIPGGNNTWTNGYFSYMIGEKYTWPTQATNYYRQFAAANGYTVAKDIYLLDMYPTNSGIVTPSDYDSVDDAKSSFDWYCARNLKGVTYDVGTNDYGYYYATNKHFDMSQLDLGYTLYNDLTEGVMTAGLLQSSLITETGIDGKDYTIIHYKDDTVSYIARLLQQTLVIPKRDGYGYNYNFVKGTPNGEQYGYDASGNALDLASALRARLGITFTESNYTATTRATAQATPTAVIGSPADTASRLYDANGKNKLIGPYLSCKDNIVTFHDAAYYLLHNLFVDDSYNERQNHYNYLVMSNATMSNGKDAYVFDGGFTTANGPGGNSAINYDPIRTTVAADGTTTTSGSGTISLTSAIGKTQIEYNNGYHTTQFPFLPIYDADDAAGDIYTYNRTPYAREDGALTPDIEGDTYEKRNYNYVMQANGEFVYHYEDSLFFQFEGDDDVYLFVNGELVLDIGAAHAITAVSMNMNDYVNAASSIMSTLSGYSASMSDQDLATLLTGLGITDTNKHTISSGDYAGSYTATELKRWHKLNLMDGESYSIDFYYMERHGWGANMRVATNIVMTDPALQTNKTAYQSGGEIPYGGTVTKDEKIEYSFSMTNAGNNKLYRLSFADNNLGVTLDSTNGLVVTGAHVTDATGGTLDPEDLVITVEGYYDEPKTQPTGVITIPIVDTVVTNEDGTTTILYTAEENLKRFLYDLQSNNTESGEQSSSLFAGAGLWRHATVTIRGIWYDMPSSVDVFDNTVFTSAHPSTTSDTVVKGEDTHRIRAVSNAVYFYQWAGHALYIEEGTLINALKSTMGDSSECSCKASNVLMLLSDSNNNARTYDSITNTGSVLTVNYETPGTKTLTYVTLLQDSNNDGKADTDNSGNVIVKHTIPVVYHVTDVEDSTLVLDYGLKADLCADGGIYTNDTVNIANSSATVMGLTTGAASYLDGYTSTKYSGNDLNRISFVNDADSNGVLAKQEGHDGQYSITGGSLYFTPTDFMDGTYTVNAAVTVHRKDHTPNAVGPANGSNGTSYKIDISKEVQMYQNVTVLPASVVYYEDDFAGIGYSGTGTFTPHGTGSGSLTQGVDQTTPYGKDPAYTTGKEMSGNSLKEYAIEDDSVFASFTFTGTGFEILSRTDARYCGTMIVTVRQNDTVVKYLPVITEFDNISNGSGGLEIIYQVPVIRVEGLTLGTYDVTIAGSPEYDVTAPKANWVCSRGITRQQLNDLLDNDNDKYDGLVPGTTLRQEWVENPDIPFSEADFYTVCYPNADKTETPYPIEQRTQNLLDLLGEFLPPLSKYQNKLYIDGIRIFQPMGSDPKNTDGKSFYNAKEAGADFLEVRKLLLDSRMAFVNWYGTGTGFHTCAGNMIWSENRNGVAQDDGNTYTATLVDSIDDYLISGPNNEVYFRRNDDKTGIKEGDAELMNRQMLLFYVKQTGETTGSLQIAARALDLVEFKNSGDAKGVDMKLRYIKEQGDTDNYVEIEAVRGSTEQYYEIDYTTCPTTTDKDGNKIYVVMLLGVSDNSSGMLSFTSLKHTGLEILPISEAETDLTNDKMMSGTSLFYDEHGMLVDPEGQTYASSYFDLRQIGQTIQAVEEARIQQAQKPGPDVQTAVPAPAPEGMSKSLKLTLLTVGTLAAVAGAWWLTKKYLHLL